jgi:uncharacterized protein
MRLAKQQAMVRCISISAHTHPRVLIEAIKRFPFDSVMFPASVLDRFVSSFEADLLPMANAAGIATITMKVFALGRLSHVHDQALRYSLGIPASMVVAGCTTLGELERDLRVADSFTPLDEHEKQALCQQVQPLVTPGNLPWKAVDWGKTGQWIKPE